MRNKIAILGGNPTRIKPWPTYDKGNVLITTQEELAAYQAINSHRYFRYDDRPLALTETAKFENLLCSTFNSPYALAVSSGTAAIALGLWALEIQPGDNIACPAFTFPATPSAILLTGAKPVLIECDENLHFDLADLQQKSKQVNFKAIIVVHMRGFASDIIAIKQWAESQAIPVIEDAVPILGVLLNGKRLGMFGDVGGFSTQSDKVINTGEGGFVLTSNETLFAKMAVYAGAFEGRLSRHFPLNHPLPILDLDYPIFSMRMDEIRAALATSQLLHLDERLKIQFNNYQYLAKHFDQFSFFSLRQPIAETALLGESLNFRLIGASLEKVEWVAAAFRAEGISARALGSQQDINVRAFWHWKFLFPTLTEDAIKAKAPNSATYIQETIDIPLSITLTKDDCDDLLKAAAKITEYLRQQTLIED